MIGQFLLETWQLLYWSLLAPAKLQQRMNEWVPTKDKDGQEKETDSWDIFIFSNSKPSPSQIRFIAQTLLLIACLVLPLAIPVTQNGRLLDGLLILLIFMAAYSFTTFAIPISLLTPIVFSVIYCEQPEAWSQGLNEILKLLPPLNQFLKGITITAAGLGVTTILPLVLLRWKQDCFARWFYYIGVISSFAIGGWISTQSLSLIAFLSGLLGIGFSGFVFSKKDSEELLDIDNKVKTYLESMPFSGFALAIAIQAVMIFAFLDKETNIYNLLIERIISGIVSVSSIIPSFLIFTVISIPFLKGFISSQDNISEAKIIDNSVHKLNTVDFSLGIKWLGFATFATLVSGALSGFTASGLVRLWMMNPLNVILPSFALSARALSLIEGNSSEPNSEKSLDFGGSGGYGFAFSMATVSFLGVYWLHLNPQVLWAAPTIIILNYYRILPEYVIFAATIYTTEWFYRHEDEPFRLLASLPPHTSRVLWFPIPKHDYVLVMAFREDPRAAFSTLQQMQASPFPGLQSTVKKALPQIVADQLVDVKTTDELIQTSSLEHPLLPVMQPTFYQISDLEGQLATPTTKIIANPEISIIFPKLQAVAQDVGKALRAGSIALRERGLERILDSLKLLELQLSGLGLTGTAIPRWQAVIQHWQQIIQRELEVQQKQSQGELPNPFQYGNPLRRDRQDLFKGRQAFADEIVRLVLDRNRPTLVLHGPRRCGKSSFLYNLPRLLPSNILPVYFDVQSAAVTTDEAGFCQGLVRAIHRDVQGINLPKVPSRNEFLSSPYIVLEDWLAQTTSKLEDKRLLLNLDEFEKIGEAIHKGRFSLQVFDELRSLIQHWDQLGFLFSGVQTLDELGPNWSSYFISVVPIEMLYLEPNEAEQLLRDPDPKFALQYDVGIVETIIKLTRCQPYLLQLLGSALVTQANRQSTQLITSELLQVAIQDAFTNGAPYFTNVWTEFTGSNSAEIVAGQQLLLEIAQENYFAPDTSDPAVQAALKRLRRYHVIEQVNENDQIEIPLLKQWISERAIKA